MTVNLDVKSVRDEITALLLAHPELVEDEVLREDMIEGSTSAFEFLSDVVRKIGSTQAIASGTAGYIEELRERRDRLERREHALRMLIFKVMQTAGLKGPIALPEATLSIRNGQPKVQIVNEREIPDRFFRVKREPDKMELKAVLLTGQHIPGAVLSNSEPTLSIRVK